MPKSFKEYTVSKSLPNSSFFSSYEFIIIVMLPCTKQQANKFSFMRSLPTWAIRSHLILFYFPGMNRTRITPSFLQREETPQNLRWREQNCKTSRREIILIWERMMIQFCDIHILVCVFYRPKGNIIAMIRNVARKEFCNKKLAMNMSNYNFMSRYWIEWSGYVF